LAKFGYYRVNNVILCSLEKGRNWHFVGIVFLEKNYSSADVDSAQKTLDAFGNVI